MPDESGRFEIYASSFPEAKHKVQVSTEGGYYPIWSPVGGELLYRAPNGAVMGVTVGESAAAIEVGRPEVRADDEYLLIPQNRHWDVSPDGERFLLLKEATAPGVDPAPPQINVVLNWSQDLVRRVPID